MEQQFYLADAPDIWTKIWRLIRPYAPRVVLAMFFSLVVSGLNGTIAWLVKPAMDYIFVERRYEYYLLLPTAVFLAYLLRGGADLLQSYLMRTAGFKLVRDLRNQFFEHLVHLPVSVVAKTASGDIVSRLMNDISMVSKILSETFRTFLVQLPSVLVLMGVALYRRWDLSLLAFTLLPLIAYGTKVLSKFVKKRRREVQQFVGLLTHRMNEMLSGLKVVKIFGMEEAKVRQFVKESREWYRNEARLLRLKEGAKYVTDILAGMAIALILAYGGYLVKEGAMTTGDFFSILTAIVMVFAPLKRLGSSYATFQESVGVLERIDDFLRLPQEPQTGKDAGPLKESLRFENVSFSYPGSGEEVLHEIDLEVEAGKVMAIVGPSGAGKSTLVDLIPKFYSPTKGKILWDGTDIQDFNPKSLRSHIGLVSQDVILFSDTIRENIAAGRPDATFEEIVAAAKKAQAHEFIEALPQGYDTMLDERGLNLSGGQRQRIALARAILHDPSLLILDEATSALDTLSEQAVQKALETVMEGRTTIVIAHRLTTIRNADQIVVMSDGYIVAKGTHEELLEQDELYRDLYRTWESESSKVLGATQKGC